MIAKDESGSNFAVATVLNDSKGFKLYWCRSAIPTPSESSIDELGWDSMEKINATQLTDLAITKSPRRIYISIENQSGEPEIVVLRPESESSSLTICRIISLPDFRSVTSLIAVEWANRLVVGCHQHAVIFKEEGTLKEGTCNRFSVASIISHLFESILDIKPESIDRTYVLQSGMLITTNKQEGINLTKVKMQRYDQDAQMKMMLGFKAIG